MKKKWILIAITICLICLGPVIYLHNAYAYSSDIPSSASSYTGRCTDITVEVMSYGKRVRNRYVLSMEDGRKFWIDGFFQRKVILATIVFMMKPLAALSACNILM